MEEWKEIAKNLALGLSVVGGLYAFGQGTYKLLVHLVRPFNLDIAVPGRIYFVFDSGESIPRIHLEFKLTNYNSYPVIFDRSRIEIKRENGESLSYDWTKFYRYNDGRDSVVDDGQAFPVSVPTMNSKDLRIEYDLTNSEAQGNWFLEKDLEDEDLELTLYVENLHRKLKTTLCKKKIKFQLDMSDRVSAYLNGDRTLTSCRIEKKIDFHNQAVHATPA